MPLICDLDENLVHEYQIRDFMGKYSHIHPDKIRRIYETVLEEYKLATTRKFLPLIIGKEVKKQLEGSLVV